ncbi:hypothetical protein MSAN_01974600 [Mycena sanguinolenta]|uniref:LysM domain-containing protein n=1 Tax=Mycena sanguinolenta TaxID=230812 RepID=A0A8H7CPI0_9AGAR|nr:hypothetical protein MSAN_01974600 [Mycena sanguinolenta]
MFSKALSAVLVTALAVSVSPALQACISPFLECLYLTFEYNRAASHAPRLTPSGCANLGIGQILCLSSSGSSGGGCTSTYTVVSGDTCAAIEAKTGVSDSQLYAANPLINSGCTSMLYLFPETHLPAEESAESRAATSLTAGSVLVEMLCRTVISLLLLEQTPGMAALTVDRPLMLSMGIFSFLSIVNAHVAPDHGTSIQVTVQDLCEGCAARGANGLDLSQGAMAALDSNYVNDGVISVIWSFA